MTYHTPELLLVGAAHNFVLGTHTDKQEIPGLNEDYPGANVYELNQPRDANSW